MNEVNEAPVPQWSDEAVAESFLTEIRARFEAHNAAYRAREAAELEVVLREHPERRGQQGFEVCDSCAWEVYQESEIQIDRNTVTIVLPSYYRVGIDLMHLFDNTTMAWSQPVIGATIVDGEARPTIEITLVATWTDEMDAAWRKSGNDRKQVLVELYEDDVRGLCALINGRPVHSDMREIRKRLELSLEALP